MNNTHETENEQKSQGCCGGSGKSKKVEANSDKHSCGTNTKAEHKKESEDKKSSGGCCG